jgi:hypothetical protein
MRLLRIPEPFDHPDWIFEPKMDGVGVAFRSSRVQCARSFLLTESS